MMTMSHSSTHLCSERYFMPFKREVHYYSTVFAKMNLENNSDDVNMLQEPNNMSEYRDNDEEDIDDSILDEDSNSKLKKNESNTVASCSKNYSENMDVEDSTNNKNLQKIERKQKAPSASCGNYCENVLKSMIEDIPSIKGCETVSQEALEAFKAKWIKKHHEEKSITQGLCISILT